MTTGYHTCRLTTMRWLTLGLLLFVTAVTPGHTEDDVSGNSELTPKLENVHKTKELFSFIRQLVSSYATEKSKQDLPSVEVTAEPKRQTAPVEQLDSKRAEEGSSGKDWQMDMWGKRSTGFTPPLKRGWIWQNIKPAAASSTIYSDWFEGSEDLIKTKRRWMTPAWQLDQRAEKPLTNAYEGAFDNLDTFTGKRGVDDQSKGIRGRRNALDAIMNMNDHGSSDYLKSSFLKDFDENNDVFRKRVWNGITPLRQQKKPHNGADKNKLAKRSRPAGLSKRGCEADDWRVAHSVLPTNFEGAFPELGETLRLMKDPNHKRSWFEKTVAAPKNAIYQGVFDDLSIGGAAKRSSVKQWDHWRDQLDCDDKLKLNRPRLYIGKKKRNWVVIRHMLDHDGFGNSNSYWTSPANNRWSLQSRVNNRRYPFARLAVAPTLRYGSSEASVPEKRSSWGWTASWQDNIMQNHVPITLRIREQRRTKGSVWDSATKVWG